MTVEEETLSRISSEIREAAETLSVSTHEVIRMLERRYGLDRRAGSDRRGVHQSMAEAVFPA